MALFRGEGEGSIPRSEIFEVPLSAAMPVSQWVFIADRNYNLIAARENHAVASASGTLQFRKVQADAIAPNAAAGANVIELIPTATSTASVANTVQNLQISIAPISKGDRLALVAGGTLTGLAGGTFQFELQPA